MTTLSWSSRLRHDDNATFQEWSSELYAKLVAAGLVQTSDTGQLTAPVVASRPGTNTAAGFWIFKLNDSLFSSAPVYVRVEVGTGTAATNPRVQIGVGTGTNGSGTLTGTALTTIRSILGGTAATTDTARQSYLCVNEGFIGLAWKTGFAQNMGGFFFARTVDGGGAATATGGMVVWGSSSSSIMASQALRFAATAVAYTLQTAIPNSALCINPQTPLTTAVGSDIQAMLAWTISPRVSPLAQLCGVVDSEVTTGNTFTATLVGSTPRTYIALDPNIGPAGMVVSTAAGGLKFAMLWE